MSRQTRGNSAKGLFSFTLADLHRLCAPHGRSADGHRNFLDLATHQSSSAISRPLVKGPSVA